MKTITTITATTTTATATTTTTTNNNINLFLCKYTFIHSHGFLLFQRIFYSHVKSHLLYERCYNNKNNNNSNDNNKNDIGIL